MSLTEGEQFISKRDILLPIYHDKWRKIILSTEPINQQEATEAVKTAYESIGRKAAKILFYESPYLSLKAICTDLKGQLGCCLGEKIMNEIDQNHLYFLAKLGRQGIWGEGDLLYWEIIHQIEKELNTRFDLYIPDSPYNIRPIRPESWLDSAGWFDFEISVKQETFGQTGMEMGLLLFKHCGWVLPFENICLVCDRPCRLSLDEQQRLHAEGEPALQFADGYSVYSYHGVDLPEKYCKLHPNQWQAEWILSEDNVELRRVLVQGIGYERICRELQAVAVDSWKEYTLLKIEIYDEIKYSEESDLLEIDRETGPMFLLKMTCPSTGFIHVLRVPPSMQTAREAICWVNWGVDPEEFSVQS